MKTKRSENTWTPMQKTMFLPLLARAFETDKKQPAIRDDLALHIAGYLDPEILSFLNRVPEFTRMAWISRSLCFERLTSDFVIRHPEATVVNIGCGMDTLYERLKLRPAMWYDLDFPEVIEYRKRFFSENPAHKFIPASFLAMDWHERVDYKENILFVASGVFYFYNVELIKKFVLRLCNLYPKFEMIFNASSPHGVKAANLLLRKAGMPDLSLKWGLKGIDPLLSWSPRIVVLGKYACFKGSDVRMNLVQKIMAYISDMLGIEYIVHLRVRPDYRRLKKEG